MIESEQLLAQFAESRSEQSFSELVRRHIDLVYSTALRAANGDTHLAEDVAQVVFADLARRAGELPGGTIVAGWLYRHTRFTTANLIRTEHRRKNREIVAVQDYQQSEQAPEMDIRPIIDDALDSLDREDRDAVVLRFFQKADFRTLGKALGVSEDAAQKRVSRALDKLRAVFEHRGITLTTVALAAALNKETVAAPLALSTHVISALIPSVAGAAGATTIAFLNTKMKLALSALALAGVATPLVWQNQILSKTKLENSDLRREIAKLSAAQANQVEAAGLLNQQMEQLRKDNKELYRLRGEVTMLRQLAQQQATRMRNDAASKQAADQEQAEAEAPIHVMVDTRFLEMTVDAAAKMRQLPLAAMNSGSFSIVLSPQETADLLKTCEKTEGVDLISAPKVTTLDGRQARVSVVETKSFNGEEVEMGPTVDILPVLAPDLSNINLSIEAKIVDIGESVAAPDGTILPTFRTRTANHNSAIPKGYSLLIGVTSGGKVNPVNEKRLVLLVTPHAMQANGTPLD